MKKPGPRTKGINAGCYGIKDMYKFYKDNYDDIIKYDEFAEICKACNKELINCVIDEMTSVILPYRFGKLEVIKLERTFRAKKNQWKVDWGRSRKEGIVVYYEDKYRYKWCWRKHYAIVINKSGYKFVASRFASRSITPAVKIKKCDYFKP